MQQPISLKLSKDSKGIVPSLLPDTNLPIELIRLILSKLPIENLEQLWVFNNDWFLLTRTLCLDFYRSAFQESTLWEYLPRDPSVQNIPLLAYFGQFLDKSWMTKFASEDCVNLGKFIGSQAMSDNTLDKLLVGIDRKLLIAEEKYLIEQRQTSKEVTITDFLKNSPPNGLSIARAYRHIETTLTLLLLASFIFEDDASFCQSTRLILDRRLTRWLTGSGLEILIEHTIEKRLLLSHLIDFALGEGDLFSKHDPEKQPIYQQNAKELLNRLTDNDCWRLLGSQRLIVVNAIKRPCFPLINRFGDRALGRAIEENPDDHMLWVLLERFGSERISKLLPSLAIEENLQKIMSNCSKFMEKLLSQLTFEELRGMVNLLTCTRFFYFINGSPFLEFLKILKVRSELKEESHENSIVSTSSKIASTKIFPRITHAPRTLLLGFIQNSYYIDEIIKSGCIIYLLPSDILGFLERYPRLWDILPISVLDKFTAQELLVLAKINIFAVSCIVERGYLEGKFKELKVLIEFALRYMENPAVPKATRMKIIGTIQPLFNAWYQKVMTDSSIDSTEPLIYWRLLLEVEKLNDKDLLWLEAECKKDTPVIYTALLQKTEDLQYQRSHPKQPDASIPVIEVLSSDTPETDSTLVEIPTSAQSNDVTSFKQPTAIIETQPPCKTQQTPQQPIPAKQIDNVSPQNSASINIALCVAKGLFVGLFIMGITILLLMFINYDPQALLMNAFLDDAPIAGIAGAFSWVVATACWLVEAEVCATSNNQLINLEEDRTKLGYEQHFQIPASHKDDHSYNSKISCHANRSEDGSDSFEQQKPKIILGNNFSTGS